MQSQYPSPHSNDSGRRHPPTRRRRRKRGGRLNPKAVAVGLTLLVILLLLFVLLLRRCPAERTPVPTEEPSDTTSAITTSPPETTQEETTQPETTQPETEPQPTSPVDGAVMTTVTVDESKWYLTLVNRHHVLPSDFTCKTADLKGGYDLDYRAAEYYNQMYDAAKGEGITLNVMSGYRRIVKQKELYENRIQRCIKEEGLKYEDAVEAAARWVLPPGTSEHNLGLAVDIGWLTRDFEDSAAFAWLQEHAADYGFILRYPEGREDVTKINYEPWHWRFIGVEDAKKFQQLGEGYTLEEYLGAV